MRKIKKVHRQILRLFIALFATALIFNQFMPAKAAGEKTELYINPANTSLNSGASISVKVFLEQNHSEDAQYVSAKIKFPAASLSVSSLSMQGSFYAQNSGDPYKRLTYNNNTGTIEMAGYNPYVNIMGAGTYYVGTINFIGKGFGPAAVTFDSGTLAAEDPGDRNILTGTRGAIYTVNNPAPPPVLPPPSAPAASVPKSSATSPPPKTPSSPAAGGGSPAAPGAATPGAASAAPDGTGAETALTPVSPDKPVISNVVVSDVHADSARISWETTPILRATFRYGTEPTDLNKEVQLADVSDKMSVELKDLPAGKTIYYEIAEVQGDQATSYFGDFKTNGQTNGLLAAGMILGGLVIAGGLLGAAYIFYKRRQHHKSRDARSGPVQQYHAPAKKEVPILAPKTNFTPLTPETVAPPVAPVVVAPSQPAAREAPHEPPKLPVTPDPAPVPLPQPVVAPAQTIVPITPVPPPTPKIPTAHGSMNETPVSPNPYPLENVPAAASHQPDETSTHWPWADIPVQTASTGRGVAAKAIDEEDIPDMYEVGQERLKEVEEHLHPHQR